MKPFDLEAAKKGAPVCDKYGHPVEIISWNKSGNTPKAICAKCEDRTVLMVDISPSDAEGLWPDLFMATSTKEGWINLYGDHWGNAMPVTSKVFPSERVAKYNISKVNDRYLATVKIEWEE